MYYEHWIYNFSTKIKPLAEEAELPPGPRATEAFELLKKDLEKVALQAIDEDRLFVVDTDVSDIVILASLNQGDGWWHSASKGCKILGWGILLWKRYQ